MRPPFAGPDDEPADIDLGIAELIAQLWGLGAVTTDCCENLGGHATVTFEDAASAEMFIDTVVCAYRPAALADVQPESLYNCVVLLGEEPDDWQDFRKRRMWRVQAQVREFGVITDHDQLRPAAELTVAVTVNFPRRRPRSGRRRGAGRQPAPRIRRQRRDLRRARRHLTVARSARPARARSTATAARPECHSACERQGRRPCKCL